MAMAGQPFYMPVLWPLAHVHAAVTKPDDEKPEENKSAPILDLVGNLTAFVASLRNFLLAVLAVYYLPQTYGKEYPAFGDAKVICWKWMAPIVIRNILATRLICGFWDWFLYFSPYRHKLHKYKTNHKYPSMSQFKHDAFYTTLSSCWAAWIEIALCYGWASGCLKMQTRLSETPLLNAFLAFTITHFRIPHFHAMHRGMHPWKTKVIPDVGKFLYRHIHSLHHKSYNPTSFSGTSMHPVESTLYYSAALIPVAFGLHPILALGVIIDCALGAWLGHDGFQWPGSGDYFHYLHHKHFDGNYGAIHVPLDWLFGTYIGCKEDVKKIWKESPAGEEANDTEVHGVSSSNDKVDYRVDHN